MLICAASLIATGCDDADAVATTRPSPTPSRVSLTAFPTTVLRSGSDVTITARITDDLGGNIEGTPVTFSTTNGSLSTTTALTSSLGSAIVTLSASDAARVTANATGLSSDVEVAAMSPFAVSLSRPSQVFMEGATFDVDVIANRDAINPPGPSGVTLNCGFGDTVDVTATRSTRCVFPSAGEFNVVATARAANGWTTTDSARVTAVSRTAPPSSSAGAITVTPSEITRGDDYAEWRFLVSSSVPMNRVEFDFGDYVDIPPGTDRSKGTKTDKVPDGDKLSAAAQFLYRPTALGTGNSKTYEVRVTVWPADGRAAITVSQQVQVTVN